MSHPNYLWFCGFSPEMQGHFFTRQTFLQKCHASVNQSLTHNTQNICIGWHSPYAISELACASVSKRVLVQNLSYENELDLHENEPVGGTHFHKCWFSYRTKTPFDRGKRQLEMAYWPKLDSLMSCFIYLPHSWNSALAAWLIRVTRPACLSCTSNCLPAMRFTWMLGFVELFAQVEFLASLRYSKQPAT